MTDDRPKPPPPPPPRESPPAPTGEPLASGIAPKTPDNPIAVAGFVISAVALLLSIIIIGGFIAIIGFVLSVIAVNRAKATGAGRRLAQAGVALAGAALLLSTVAFGVIANQLESGEERRIDGVTTTSSNTAFPPQHDIKSVECDSSGALGLATVTIQNNSPGPSFYTLTIEWATAADGTEVGTLRSDLVQTGDMQTLRLFDTSANGVPGTCRVTRIERSRFGLFLS